MQGNMDMHLIWNITLSKVYIHDIVITTKITKYIIRRKKLSKFVTNEHKQTLNLCVFDFQLVPQKSTWLNIHVNSFFFILTLHTLISFIHFKPTIIHKTFTQHTEHFLVNKAINCVYCDKCRKDMNECKRCIWPFSIICISDKDTIKTSQIHLFYHKGIHSHSDHFYIIPYNPGYMTITSWKNLAWGAGDVNMLSWENLAVNQGD